MRLRSVLFFLLVSFILFFTSFPLFASPNIFIRITKDYEKLVAEDMSQSNFINFKDAKRGKTLLDGNPDLAPIIAMAKDSFIIRVFDDSGSPITFSTSNITRVIFSIDNNPSLSLVCNYDLTNSKYKDKSCAVIPIEYGDMSEFADSIHKTLLQIDCQNKDGISLTKFYVRRLSSTGGIPLIPEQLGCGRLMDY